MEGPSLYLAAERLSPFIGKKVLTVTGNTKIEKEKLLHKKVLNIFSWGKHLVFQFDSFAIRIHFLLFGSFEATVKDVPVTGDYRKKVRIPKLAITFSNGHIEMYGCSIQEIDSSNALENYDFSTDIMSTHWDSHKAIKKIKKHPNSEIADLLLDQTIFSGVGNIIKNEVLYLEKISPLALARNISAYRLRKIIKQTQEYVFKFYEWRKIFTLKKHFQIYHKKICPRCNGTVIKEKTGQRARISCYCPHCQKENYSPG